MSEEGGRKHSETAGEAHPKRPRWPQDANRERAERNHKRIRHDRPVGQILPEYAEGMPLVGRRQGE